MVPVTGLSGKKVAVFGLGRSGLATCSALVAGGADVLAWDDNEATRAAAAGNGVALSDLHDANWDEITALILSPGVPLTHPEPHWTVPLAKAAGVEIIGDTELFERARAVRAPKSRLVAITGTNGKSTTTALIAHILKQAGLKVEMGGNIGTPILALNDVADDRIYVIEYSSYQIDLTPSLAPTVGILLNLSEDHLDRHGDMKHYAAVKARLVAAAAKKHLSIVGVDDDHSAAIAARIEDKGGRVLRISVTQDLERGVVADQGVLSQVLDGFAQPLVDLAGISSLRGAHNWQNAAAAFAACRALGLLPDVIAAGLASFPGMVHRMEQVGALGNVLFINDSKATNADAAARALGSFDQIYWIAGGRAKSGGIASLERFFPRIAHAYLIGEAAEIFAKTLDGKVAFTISGDLGAAVAAAASAATASTAREPVVLLSPACASFDQFANFEARGDAFRELAKGIVQQGAGRAEG